MIEFIPPCNDWTALLIFYNLCIYFHLSNLMGNPFVCNCSMAWMSTALASNLNFSKIFVGFPKCNETIHLKNLTLPECKRPDVSITHESPTTNLSAGAELTLSCYGTGSPPPQVNTHQNGKQVIAVNLTHVLVVDTDWLFILIGSMVDRGFKLLVHTLWCGNTESNSPYHQHFKGR